ncbi:MAG: hypothetical protein C4589_11765 [Peptococcaceae bacterium]|jgi:hypothetical protein|nr:MAG: hypothetical protein C4589_11765 [Peptococcaceae bacterium]
MNNPSDFVFPDPTWAAVCHSCPLKECTPGLRCPIKIALRNDLHPKTMVFLNKLAGTNNPAGFKDIVSKVESALCVAKPPQPVPVVFNEC